MLLKEACVESREEICSAISKCADRMELCSALSRGGLTPSKKTTKFLLKNTAIPVVAMIRRKWWNFQANWFELNLLKLDVIRLSKLNVNGFVFGFVTKDKKVDVNAMAALMQYTKNKEVVFHMAFDLIDDKFAAIDVLAKLGVTRILTKGGSGSASDNIDTLKKINDYAKNKIQIIAGGKVTEENYKKIADATGIRQFHGRKLSC